MYLQRWHGWCPVKLLPSRRFLCTPYNHALCHFMQSLIRKVHAYLAVTRHQHFWQKDSGLLRATAVTHGRNWYLNKSQHRKLTLEKKILSPLLQGFEPATFRSRVRRSNHWAIPAPRSPLTSHHTYTRKHTRAPISPPSPVQIRITFSQLPIFSQKLSHFESLFSPMPNSHQPPTPPQASSICFLPVNDPCTDMSPILWNIYKQSARFLW